MFIDEQAHELGNCKRWMGVVQLDGELLVKAIECLLALQIQANHVLERARYEKILLLQPELASLNRLVIRIKHLRDIFRFHFVVDGTVEVTRAE